jgi:hypothetical protein
MTQPSQLLPPPSPYRSVSAPTSCAQRRRRAQATRQTAPCRCRATTARCVALVVGGVCVRVTEIVLCVWCRVVCCDHACVLISPFPPPSWRVRSRRLLRRQRAGVRRQSRRTRRRVQSGGGGQHELVVRCRRYARVRVCVQCGAVISCAQMCATACALIVDLTSVRTQS